MRSLSSTVREMPSSWLPSRSVVSKTSTDPGRVTSSDMFDPVLVAIDLSANGGEVDLLDGPGHRPRLADEAVVDLSDRHHLGGRPGQESLLAHVQITAEDVADLDLVAKVARDRHHRVLGDALEGAGRHGRRDDAAPAHDEDVLPRALADVALGREQDRLVVAGLEGLGLGHRRVD